MRFSATLLSLAASAAPGLAFFRMPCPGRVVTERADPIVDPGKPSSHSHTISGGNGFDFTMSYNSTQSSTCSSCPIKKDLSNYWTPNLYYQMQNGSFQYVPQAGDGVGTYGGMTVYYLQRGGPQNDNLTAFPAGFRMLAGDPMKRTGGSDFASQAISYVCLNYSSTSPYYNKLPDQPCPDGLRAQIFFPSCWDGVNLDSSDHKSHMAYPTMYSYDNGPCPASHPVHLVSIFYEIIYSTISFPWWVPDGGWQPFVFSNGDPTGYGFHGDFVNGWDVPTLQRAINNCTADSGLLEDCPVIANDLFTNDQSQACILAPKINEQITGVMNKLPGCNPVTYNSTGMNTDCNDTAVIGAPATYYKNVTGWQYVGCGSDNGVNRTFQADKWWSNSVTVEGCMDYCKSRGHAYAGLEYSTQCFCGDSLPSDRAPVKGVLGNCFSPCAGDSSEYCGGSNRLSIYYNPNAYQQVSSSNSNSVPRLPACPTSNGTMYNTTNSATFQVQCGTDRSGGDIGMQYVQGGNITACIEVCSNTKSCTYVALSGAACYMKTGTNLRAISSSSVAGAQLMTPGTISNTTSTSASAGATGGAASTSAAASTSTSTMCPDSDGQVINNYTVRCTSDSSVGSFTNAQASSSYLDCMTACDNAASTNCIGFVYVGGTNGRGSGTCWLKTAMGTIVTGRGPNYIAAYKPKPGSGASASSTSAAAAGSASAASSSNSGPATAAGAPAAGSTYTTAPTCPGSNATYYSSSTGATFLIECGIDHAGGDIGSVSVRNLQQCIEVCAGTSGCVDVSLSGVACYMKGTVGAINYNNVYGAKLVSGPSTVSANGNRVATNGKFLKVASKTTSKTTTKKAAKTTKKAAKKVTKKAKTTTTKKAAKANVKKVTKKTTSTKKVTKSKTTTLAKVSPSVVHSSAVSKAATSKSVVTSKSAVTSPSKTILTTTKQTTTKTTASPSSTVTSIDCPYSNQTYYVDPESKYEFFLECGIDRQGYELSNSTAKNLTACIKLCAETEDCADLSYDKHDKQCYLKSKAGTDKEFVSTVNGARLYSKPTTTTSVPAATSSAKASNAPASSEPAESTEAATLTSDAPVATGSKRAVVS